ncbi:hypothetical protein [Romboutsia sp. 1001285H_161024_C4]|uniref:hypothetical protein n=1 Tax=Romboutsia sp. 1001285H_161024_C4 TaxID=2787109 RepID=UPI0018983895|nr:hypothetical protein [Romboutsia sp. 1001285H_161024_C4]
MKPNVSEKLSKTDGLTTYNYKIILYLDAVKEATQSKMAEELLPARCEKARKQTINRACKELESMNIIRIKRKEGRNIIWELNPNPDVQIQGQTKIEGL